MPAPGRASAPMRSSSPFSVRLSSASSSWPRASGSCPCGSLISFAARLIRATGRRAAPTRNHAPAVSRATSTTSELPSTTSNRRRAESNSARPVPTTTTYGPARWARSRAAPRSDRTFDTTVRGRRDAARSSSASSTDVDGRVHRPRDDATVRWRPPGRTGRGARRSGRRRSWRRRGRRREPAAPRRRRRPAGARGRAPGRRGRPLPRPSRSARPGRRGGGAGPIPCPRPDAR